MRTWSLCAALGLSLLLTSCASWVAPSVAPVGEIAIDPRASAPAARAAPAVATPVVAAPSPVSGELPRELDVALSAHVTCRASSCALAGLFPSEADPGPSAPAAIWSEDLAAAGSAASVPRHAGVDVAGVVLSGEVLVRGLEATAGATVGRWSAFYAPGAGVSVAAKGGPARLALFVVTAGAPVREAAALLADKARAKSVDWETRAGAIEVVDLEEVRDLAWGGGAMHARLGFEGARNASLGVLIASKDAAVPQHQHDTSWELLAVLRGEGQAGLAAAPGETALGSVAVRDGSIVAMPKATQHAFLPGKTKPLVTIQLYVPPGPEQRFKKLADDAARP